MQKRETHLHEKPDLTHFHSQVHSTASDRSAPGVQIPTLDGKDILLTNSEAARMLLCKPQTLRARRLKGGKSSIPYVRLGESRKARVAYRLSDLKAYLAARVYTNTAEESVKEGKVQE
jgi:hypothetical protein